MASPFATLRKYQFAFFVFFGVVLMIVFVIGDVVMTWMPTPGGAGQQEKTVVVTWRGGALTESELQYEQGLRNVLGQFFDALMRETQNRRGIPRVSVPTLATSEEGIVLSRVLASKAEEAGMVVNDEVVLQYLEKLSADLIPRSEIGDIFRKSAGERVSEQQLLNELKIELLAQNFLTVTYPDLSGGQLPGQAWNYYQRLHRRVKAEVIPLTVAEFKSKVSKEPTETEIKTLYDQARERYPDPLSPEPGFRRHRQAAFDFVRADRKKFEDEELAKIKPQVTNAEIEEYYEKNKSEFRVTDPPAGEPEKTPGAPGTEKPATEQPADTPANKPEDKPADKPADKPEDKPVDKPDGEKPAPTADGAPSESKPSEKPPADSPAKDSAPDSSSDGAAPPGSCEQEGNQDSPAVNGEKVRDAAKPSDVPKAEPADTEAKPQPAVPATKDEPKQAEPKLENAPVRSESPPAGGTKSDSEDGGKAEGKSQADPKPADESTAKTESSEVKYKPLNEALREEIREKVAQQKASRAAHERISTGLNEIARAVEKYARQAKSAELAEKPMPAPVDVKKMASERAFEAGSVPLSGPYEIQETELGKTFTFDMTGGSFRQIGFHVIAYGEGIPLYRPAEIQGQDFNVIYLYWKTKDIEPFIPELTAIRSEVVDAWKQREALSLAIAHARSLADKVAPGGKSLKEAFGDTPGLAVKETNEFSWMTSGFVAAGMGTPALSDVEGVDHAGDDFMKSVFALKPGEVGVAVNQPKTEVYVVRVASESPSQDTLREMFLQTGVSMEVQQIAAMDRREIFENWRKDLERDMNVKWVREPRT